MAGPWGEARPVASGDRPSRAGAPWRMALVLVACFVIGAGAALLARQTGGIELAKITGLVDRMTTGAYAPGPPASFAGAVAPRAMPVCGVGRRMNCVVDGDTIWLDGEKIRILDIDAPEMKGRCGAEKTRAAEATRELARLLDRRPIRLVRRGEDRYGRTLATVATPDGDVGDLLVARRLAVTWRGRREPAETWCGN